MPTPSLVNIPFITAPNVLFSQIPEGGAGDFTVQRTTTVANRSTRINKDGFIETVLDNVPRLDYPLGGAVNGCPALLVEPSAQNLFLRSQEFDNASWFKDRLNTTGTPPWVNVEVAPDGTTTAEKFIQASGTLVQGFAQQDVSVTGGLTYVISVFAKQGTRHIPQIRTNIDGTSKGAFFNTSNGTLGTVEAGLSASIENYGNGWYRCSVRVTASTNATRFCLFSNAQTNNTQTVSDDGGFQFFWGAQLETGSVATSYIPTTTAQVTRSADVIRNTTATALIGQTEGTIYWEGAISRIDRVIFSLAQGTSVTNSIYLQTLSNGFFRADVLANNSSTCAILSLATATLGQFYKIAFAYKENDFALYINGVLQGSDNLGALPSGLSNAIFARGDSSLITDQRCRALELHPNRLSNLRLEFLTAPVTYTTYAQMANALSYILP